MVDSCAVLRTGSGSGIQVLSWNAPFDRLRNVVDQSEIASASISSAPQAPMPPASATAAASAGGQAPAMGAIRIGTRRPYTWAKSSARVIAG